MDQADAAEERIRLVRLDLLSQCEVEMLGLAPLQLVLHATGSNTPRVPAIDALSLLSR